MALHLLQGAFGVFAMTFGAPLKEPLDKSVEAEFAVGKNLTCALAIMCTRPGFLTVTSLPCLMPSVRCRPHPVLRQHWP